MLPSPSREFVSFWKKKVKLSTTWHLTTDLLLFFFPNQREHGGWGPARPFPSTSTANRWRYCYPVAVLWKSGIDAAASNDCSEWSDSLFASSLRPSSIAIDSNRGTIVEMFHYCTGRKICRADCHFLASWVIFYFCNCFQRQEQNFMKEQCEWGGSGMNDALGGHCFFICLFQNIEVGRSAYLSTM